MKSTRGLQDEQAPDKLHARGAIRRMVVTLTSKAIWQLAGFLLGDGKREAMTAEPFTGIGFSSRPPANGKPEAIVLLPGDDARQPVVVAVRDEKTRQAIVGALLENETAMFNDAALVHIKAGGTIEARSKNGVAVPLATKADVDAIRNALNGHSHQYIPPGSGGGAPIATTGNPAVPAPAGTSVLKGE